MFEMNAAIKSGWYNHEMEKAQIIKDIAHGKIPYVGDYYTWNEIEEMEDELYRQYGIKADLSFLAIE